MGEQPLRGAGDVAVARRGTSRASARGRSRTGRRRRRAARPSPRRSAAARPGPRSWRAAAAGRRRCPRTRARRGRRRPRPGAPRRRWRPAAPRGRRGRGRPGRSPTREWPTAKVKPCRLAGSSRAIASATRATPSSSAAGSSTATGELSPAWASSSAASEPGALERAARSAAPSTRPRQSSSAGRVVVRAHDHDRAAAGEVDPELPAAGDDVAAVGDLAAQDRGAGTRAWAASDARSGARRRSTSEAISVVMTRRSAAGGSPARPRSRSRPTTASPTRSSCTDDAGGVGHQRPLVRGRARGDGEHAARAVDQDERGVERARRGAHDLGQPETALDRLGDGLEGAEVRRRRHLRPGRRGHGAKSSRLRSRRSTRGSPRRRRRPSRRTPRGCRGSARRARIRSPAREYDVQAGTTISAATRPRRSARRLRR